MDSFYSESTYAFDEETRLFSIKPDITSQRSSDVHLVCFHGLGVPSISNADSMRPALRIFNYRGELKKASSTAGIIGRSFPSFRISAEAPSFPGYHNKAMLDIAQKQNLDPISFHDLPDIESIVDLYWTYFHKINLEVKKPIILLGRSYLGALGIFLADAINEKAKKLNQKPLISGVVSMSSSYPGVKDLVEKNTKAMYSAYPQLDYEATEWASDLYKSFSLPERSHLPTIIMCSRDDQVVLPEDQNLYDQFARRNHTNTRFLTVEGDTHDLFSNVSSHGFQKRARHLAYLAIYRFAKGIVEGDAMRYMEKPPVQSFSYQDELSNTDTWYAPMSMK
ncbi:hypothetical protein [Neptuniibacter sp.]|uniref:hypothetical protein n=1 Tax=Neptuniibacter sp. TaxID=1962643 RepID=UPI00262BC7E3|nr:hypothetical protein [Neptuniibacter sp.]MCP4598272.1 hypothetical protein [Neptuniibacter sp.]